MVIFDEIHKMKNWKLWLKGIVDTEENNKFIVTGSARIETLKKVGDSLAGRYFHYQLFPFDLKELSSIGHATPTENLNRLLKVSGFPEPFLGSGESYYRKWRRTHLDVILKQDVIVLDGLKRIEEDYSLHFLKDNKQLEIDFLICKGKKPIVLIEVKTTDLTPSKNFLHFIKMNPLLFKDAKKFSLFKI